MSQVSVHAVPDGMSATQSCWQIAIASPAVSHGAPPHALADGDSAWSAAGFGFHTPAVQPPGASDLGFGRIVAEVIEAPHMIVNMA